MSTKKRNDGFNSQRLNPNQNNPMEVAFAEKWESENARNLDSAAIIGHLVPAPITERDRRVAATIVQWLGSSVGFAFLVGVLKKCGYQVIDDAMIGRLADQIDMEYGVGGPRTGLKGIIRAALMGEQ